MKGKKDKINSEIQGRLIEICDDNGLSLSAFSKSIGMSSSYLNSLNKNITVDVLNKILSVYPEYNIYWLTSGKEPKFNKDIQENGLTQISDKLYEYLIKQNQELNKRIEELNREMGRLESQLMGLGVNPARQDTNVDCADADMLRSAL